MPTTITLDEAAYNLEELLRGLSPGDTVTLVEANGAPLAVLVTIRPAVPCPSVPDWSRRWRELAGEIGQAWKAEQSALQILADMRR